MAEYTDNFNLIKPGQDEFYNVEIFNNNADIIDAELKNLKNTIENLNADGITLPDGKTISEKFEEITGEVGNIQELNTDEKANIVAAINEIYQTLLTHKQNTNQEIGQVASDLAAHKADYVHLPYSIADGTDTYTTLINGISSLVEGMSIKIKFTNANTGACTLNINGLGAIPIKKSNGNDLSAGNIRAGQIAHLVYTGSVFQLLGEGGEYGTAQPEHVLEGYTIGTEEGLKTGTMPNRGAVTNTITTQGGSYIIPAGYHNGSGKVTANFANLVAENIKSGVNIGGVIGTLKDMEDIDYIVHDNIDIRAVHYSEEDIDKYRDLPSNFVVTGLIAFGYGTYYSSGGRSAEDYIISLSSSPSGYLSRTIYSSANYGFSLYIAYQRGSHRVLYRRKTSTNYRCDDYWGIAIWLGYYN